MSDKDDGNPARVPDYGDPTYRYDVGRAAFKLAGAGFPAGKIRDLDEKLELFRAIAGLSHRGWPDTVLARLIFGDGEHAAATFNKKKHGSVALTEDDGAALAQALNGLGRLPGEARVGYAPGALDARLIGEMVATPPGNSGLTAADLAAPLIEFVGRAAVAVTEAGADNLDTVHRRVMAFLNGLSARSHPTQPALFYRQRESGQSVERFGDDQRKPDLPVWEWEPLTLVPGERLLIGLPTTIEIPSEVWALTVRDPRPPSPHGASGRHCWNESWENLVRWTVPEGPLEPGATPEISYGKVVDLRGEYSLFVLVDHGASGAIRAAVGGEFGAPVGMDGFFRLLKHVANPNTPLGFDCYVRRYRIRAG